MMSTNAGELYTDQDLFQNATQMRRVLVGAGLLSLPFLTALISSLIIRTEWFTILITVGWGALLLFIWDIKIAPVRAYRRHLRGLISGLRRSAEGTVISLSEEGSFKDGVFFDTLILNVDPKLDPEGERLFYVDRCKPRLSVSPGDFLRVVANGNYLTAWEVAR